MNPDALNSDLSAPLVARHAARPASAVRRAVTAAVLGQILEWYDFFLYGTAAALVFGKLFFPMGSDPLTGTIAAFGGFTVGFIARPIGGVLCGHLGDRYGRKAVMMLTLFTMGTATVLMGALPTYHQIGIAAPVLLVILRILQGLAAGGGLSPMIATGLLAYYRSAVPVAIYLGALGLVTVIATCFAPETYPKAMRIKANQQAE